MMRFLRGAIATALFFISVSAGISQSVTKGFASTYPLAMEGSNTASGELYISTEFTACHSSLPFNTLVKVTNLKNNKSVTVRINDRFNFRNSRVIDVSNAAATEISLFDEITPQVSIEVIGIADAIMMASVKAKQDAAKNPVKIASTPAPTLKKKVPAEKQQPVVASVTTTPAQQPATPEKAAPATASVTPDVAKTQVSSALALAEVKKETPELLSGIKISIPTISVEAISNLATISIKYLSMGFLRR